MGCGCCGSGEEPPLAFEKGWEALGLKAGAEYRGGPNSAGFQSGFSLLSGNDGMLGGSTATILPSTEPDSIGPVLKITGIRCCASRRNRPCRGCTETGKWTHRCIGSTYSGFDEERTAVEGASLKGGVRLND
jgi:hypothetical protein